MPVASNIRKHLFDKDCVEAIIQMPSDEFFNTGIVTYLWVLNKNKPADRCNKVILINAADLWQPLKKNKGSKRKEMNETHRADIVRALVEFRDSEISKVYDKWHFYFNKQQIQLTEVDNEGLFVSETLGCPGEVFKIKDEDVVNVFSDGTCTWPLDEDSEGEEYAASMIKSHHIQSPTVVSTSEYIYWIDKPNGTIMRTKIETGEHKQLGNGVLSIQYSRTRSGDPKYTVKISDATSKDTEIIQYYPDPADNDRAIMDFLTRYVSKPFRLLDNTVGVEVNFNKEFYVPETVEPVETILAEIADIDRDLANLEKELGL